MEDKPHTQADAQDNFQEKTLIIYTGTAWECDMVKSLLDDEEIPCFISNAIPVYGSTPLFSDRVSVYVLEKDQAAAQTVVDRYQPA